MINSGKMTLAMYIYALARYHKIIIGCTLGLSKFAILLMLLARVSVMLLVEFLCCSDVIVGSICEQ